MNIKLGGCRYSDAVIRPERLPRCITCGWCGCWGWRRFVPAVDALAAAVIRAVVREGIAVQLDAADAVVVNRPADLARIASEAAVVDDEIAFIANGAALLARCIALEVAVSDV